ncbi:VOC family protein [Leptospira sp. GIMC2001]|uniref:VOC family protein n=1 Tax=Leptospira sp. GIMC2001 TaxID=1513297 RepID=UPI00234B8FB1|nr:VOC family protein [Leptospira sp. GIMC2001]WCL50629.1 VOC family protein [Leptospira sp. GIMC2001]
MEQRISVLTIGAHDLAAMKNFYGQVLGWTTIAENNDIVFYKLNGILLSICDRKMLASFIGVDHKDQDFRSVIIGYNVDRKEEVLEIYEQLKDKVKILKEPTEPPFAGLFFYFSDIEGNIIEVAQNSFVTLDEAKNAIDHKSISHL